MFTCHQCNLAEQMQGQYRINIQNYLRMASFPQKILRVTILYVTA